MTDKIWDWLWRISKPGGWFRRFELRRSRTDRIGEMLAEEQAPIVRLGLGVRTGFADSTPPIAPRASLGRETVSPWGLRCDLCESRTDAVLLGPNGRRLCLVCEELRRVLSAIEEE